MPEPAHAILCPYCGDVSSRPDRCSACAGRFDPLSRQATQNAMGPWSFRDPGRAFLPGFGYDTLRRMVERGTIRPESVIRGPTTRQFWEFAKRTPGVAHLLGVCHSCQSTARAEEAACRSCGAWFEVDTDRQHLGLSPVRLLPGSAPANRVAESALPPAWGNPPPEPPEPG